MSVLELLRTVIERNGARVVAATGDRIVVSVSPPLDSGAPAPTYEIEVACEGGALSASETEPRLLPAWCPERHVNADGTFCLYWAEEEPLSFGTEDDVELWWGKVMLFLRRQLSVDRLRRWPGRADARAHGAKAARAQASTERAAEAMGPMFAAALRDGRLAASRVRRGNHRRVRLTLDGRRIASVDVDAGRVLMLRSRCRCERGAAERRPLSDCGNHAGILAELTLSLDRWALAEREFFRFVAACGRECCGSVDTCPLPRRSAFEAREAA